MNILLNPINGVLILRFSHGFKDEIQIFDMDGALFDRFLFYILLFLDPFNIVERERDFLDEYGGLSHLAA